MPKREASPRQPCPVCHQEVSSAGLKRHERGKWHQLWKRIRDLGDLGLKRVGSYHGHAGLAVLDRKLYNQVSLSKCGTADGPNRYYAYSDSNGRDRRLYHELCTLANFVSEYLRTTAKKTSSFTHLSLRDGRRKDYVDELEPRSVVEVHDDLCNLAGIRFAQTGICFTRNGNPNKQDFYTELWMTSYAMSVLQVHVEDFNSQPFMAAKRREAWVGQNIMSILLNPTSENKARIAMFALGGGGIT